MRIGALVPNSGRWPLELGIPRMAATLEEAGFDSLWVSDHVVLPEEIVSWYPFADDGRATWPTDDAVLRRPDRAGADRRRDRARDDRHRGARAAAQAPGRLREAGRVDRPSPAAGASGSGSGRAGCEEEFDALDVPFEDRNGRLVEWMAIARDCWTGTPAARTTDRYTLPAGRALPPDARARRSRS